MGRFEKLLDVLEKIFDLVVFPILALVLLYFLITMLWIGAEVVFEGAVHTSKVDSYMAGLVAWYLYREIRRFEAKWVRMKEAAHE